MLKYYCMCKDLIPFAHASNIYEVDVLFFKELGLKYLFLDLDNTLDSYKQTTPTPKAVEFISKIRNLGIIPIIISNNRGKRVKMYSEALGVEFLSSSGKPFPWKVKKLIKTLNIRNEEVMLVGDQMVTDIRCGNGAKIKTLLVDKLVKEDQWTTRFNRIIEKPFRKHAFKKGKLVNWRTRYGKN